MPTNLTAPPSPIEEGFAFHTVALALINHPRKTHTGESNTVCCHMRNIIKEKYRVKFSRAGAKTIEMKHAYGATPRHYIASNKSHTHTHSQIAISSAPKPTFESIHFTFHSSPSPSSSLGTPNANTDRANETANNPKTKFYFISIFVRSSSVECFIREYISVPGMHSLVLFVGFFSFFSSVFMTTASATCGQSLELHARAAMK